MSSGQAGWSRVFIYATAAFLLCSWLFNGLASGGPNAWTTSVADRSFSQIVIDPNNQKNVYAAGDSSGNPYVYKSTDGGATWTSSSAGLSAFTVNGLAVGRANSSILYIGGYNSNSHSLALYQSNNGGTSWNQLNPNLGDTIIQGIAVDPNTTSWVYLATNRALYKSIDNGASFNVMTGMSNLSVRNVTFDNASPPNIWAGSDATTSPGTWKSPDGGATWLLQATGALANSSVVSIATGSVTPSSAVVYTAVASSPYQLFKSANGGTNWGQVGGNVDPVSSVAVDPLNDANVFYVSSSGLYRSTNGGSSFTKVAEHNAGPVRLDNANPQTIYVGGQGIKSYTGNLATISLVTPTPTVCAPPATPPGSGQSFTFSTGHTVSGVWLDYVRGHGDVDNLGLPRTEVICDPLTGQTVQYFQRVVLEFHPEAVAGNQVQRRLLVDALYPGPADPPADPSSKPKGDSVYFANGANGLGHWVSDSAPDGSSVYFKQYFDSHGKEGTFGYPKEEPQQRPGADGATRWTQRLQAAVFEYHAENDKDGKVGAVPLRNYRVQLELLGDEYIAKNNLGFK